jgi:hypothetical protein
MRGYSNYFGVTNNSRALYRFERVVQHLLCKWLKQRSQRRSFTCGSFCRYAARPPTASSRHLYVSHWERPSAEACAGTPLQAADLLQMVQIIDAA